MSCPRVAFRMECPECGYPYSEALFSLNIKMPHSLTKNKKEIKQIIMQYQNITVHTVKACI